MIYANQSLQVHLQRLTVQTVEREAFVMRSEMNINLHKKAAIRVIAFVTALVTVCLVMSLPAVLPRAGAADAISDTVKMYHWKKVKKQADIPTSGEYHFMLVWTINFKDYYTCGNSESSSVGRAYVCKNAADNLAISTYADEFYTFSDCDTWTLSYTGKDSANGDMKRVKIKNTAGKYMWVDTDRDFFGTAYDASLEWHDSGDPITICTSEVDCKYARNTSAGKVQIYYNVSSGDDGELLPYGYSHDTSLNDLIYMRPNESYNYYDFTMYIAYEETRNCMGSYTVSSGNTLQIPHDAILKPGCTLTIENGAIVSISGQFFNNGTIDNKGTLLIQKGGCIASMDFDKTKYPAAGSIYCRGTKNTQCDLIVLGGGAVILPTTSAVLEFTRTNVVNYGIILTPANISVSGTMLDNKKNSGVILTGHSIVRRKASYDEVNFNPFAGSANVLGVNFNLAASGYSDLTFFLEDDSYLKTSSDRIKNSLSGASISTDRTSKYIFY